MNFRAVFLKIYPDLFIYVHKRVASRLSKSVWVNFSDRDRMPEVRMENPVSLTSNDHEPHF